MWTIYNWLPRNKTLSQCGKYLTKKSIWENQHLFLIMFIGWVALDDNVKQTKILWTITEICLSPKSSMTILAGKNQNINSMWTVLMKDVDQGEPTSFLDPVNLGCTQRESVRSVTMLWQATEMCSNPGFLLEPRKNCLPELQGNLMQKRYLHGLMTWKAMQRNAWSDIANLRTKRLNNNIKSLLHVLATINSQKKK